MNLKILIQLLFVATFYNIYPAWADETSTFFRCQLESENNYYQGERDLFYEYAADYLAIYRLNYEGKLDLMQVFFIEQNDQDENSGWSTSSNGELYQIRVTPEGEISYIIQEMLGENTLKKEFHIKKLKSGKYFIISKFETIAETEGDYFEVETSIVSGLCNVVTNVEMATDIDTELLKKQ